MWAAGWSSAHARGEIEAVLVCFPSTRMLLVGGRLRLCALMAWHSCRGEGSVAGPAAVSAAGKRSKTTVVKRRYSRSETGKRETRKGVRRQTRPEDRGKRNDGPRQSKGVDEVKRRHRHHRRHSSQLVHHRNQSRVRVLERGALPLLEVGGGCELQLWRRLPAAAPAPTPPPTAPAVP